MFIGVSNANSNTCGWRIFYQTLSSNKKLVKQIVLIAGDSDFTPAAKLARREGIDFIVDPMWNPINQDLHEHIDGLMSTCPQPKKSANVNKDKESA